MDDTFVIGDSHGHMDRLEALLAKAGVPKPGVTVVHLGDLIHAGLDTKANDRAMVGYALNNIDILCRGNHDQAVFDSRHQFSGYSRPFPETIEVLNKLEEKMVWAYAAHDYLMTHAGLHEAFAQQRLDKSIKTDLESFVTWINADLVDEDDNSRSQEAVRHAVGRSRGGSAFYGGILWRDASEPLYEVFRQIFGHTSVDGNIRTYPNGSYCIDIGNQYNGRLAGIWLPSLKVVEVSL
jgi:predicted phosphodiesterase